MAYALDVIAWFYAEAWLLKRRWRRTRWGLSILVFDASPIVVALIGIFVLPRGWGAGLILIVGLALAPMALGRHFAERRNYFDDL